MSSKNESAALGLNEEQILELAKNADMIKKAAERIAAQREAAAKKAAAEAAAKASHLKKVPSPMNVGRTRNAAHQRYSTGVPWFDAMTDEEQMRSIAEANLKAYGSIVPPVEARLAPLVKECPGCGKVKSVVADFGLRMYKGVPRSQSHCRKCRRESDLHHRNHR